ncbi:MAG: hypothetical protein IKF01_03200 [Bacilli bacterium]|nr:hypothetical protein [Bacilli bacterium]
MPDNHVLKLTKMLKNLLESEKYQDEYTLIKETYLNVVKLYENKDDVTSDDLDNINENIKYLDMKYDDLFDLVNLYDPIRINFKKVIQEKKVKKIREENKKKREEK